MEYRVSIAVYLVSSDPFHSKYFADHGQLPCESHDDVKTKSLFTIQHVAPLLLISLNKIMMIRNIQYRIPMELFKISLATELSETQELLIL